MDNLYNLQFADDLPYGAVMKVVGVGGAGGNAVNRMVSSRLAGVETIAMNTDIQALNRSAAMQKIPIGRNITRGRGAGADPAIGLKAAEQDEALIAEVLKGTDLTFITAGMGGGTGTGAAPKLAEIAHHLDSLTVAIVTLPFTFEGRQRMKVALEGVEKLREYVDTLVVIPNESLLGIIEDDTPLREAFKIADMVLAQATRGISDLIAKTGEPNLDFSDVRTVMRKGGDALIGLGVASGKDRAGLAARQALKCPLLQSLSISGASQVLVNITGTSNMAMREVSEAMNLIYREAGENANVIFGAVIDDETDEDLSKNMNITVIATGLSCSRSRVEKPVVEEAVVSIPAGVPLAEKLREEPVRTSPKFGYDEPAVAASLSASPRNWSQGETRGNGHGNGSGSGNGNGDGKKDERTREEIEARRIHIGEIDLDGEPPRNLDIPAFMRNKPVFSNGRT